MRTWFYTILPGIFLLCCSVPVRAAHKHPERWYQERWCAEQGGEIEVTLSDRSRCDCLTDTHAIEFDFAEKWRHAIGQALSYALQTGKLAGIVLIVETEKDKVYVEELQTLIQHFALPIELWWMTQES